MSIEIQYGKDLFLDGIEPIVILGPNGSGKTRFGRKLENMNHAEYIAALRNIALSESIPMQSMSQAKNNLSNIKREMQRRPWHIDEEINHLFSKLMVEDSSSAIEFRENYQNTNTKPTITKLMMLNDIWSRLFPGRKIDFKNYNPIVISEFSQQHLGYPALQMSDGERVAMYLAGRVLDTNSKIIIVDEPEVHFHSRLAIQFWDELESIRKDCRFIYITHDLTFARSRKTNTYMIIKSKEEPIIINLKEEDIPTDIVESILSAATFSIYANKLIFCEGSESSYDQKIFRAWYNRKDEAVIPVGSCRDVIRCASTFSENKILSGVTAIGIIDFDYWPGTFIESLPSSVTCLPVHEIESLLCKKSIFFIIGKHIGKSVDICEDLYEEFLTDAKSKFVDGLFIKQISERFRKRCENQFITVINQLKIDGTMEEIRNNHCSSLAPANWSLLPEIIFDEEQRCLEEALLSSADVFLKYFPGKVCFPILTKKIGMATETYIEIISNSLIADNSAELYTLGVEIRSALADFFPNVA